MSSNHKLCHLVSTCHFNGVIQSLNTVIVLLFCYLPVFYYLPVFCYSAIPLVTGPVSVLVGVWYWLHGIIHYILLHITWYMVQYQYQYQYDAICYASTMVSPTIMWYPAMIPTMVAFINTLCFLFLWHTAMSHTMLKSNFILSSII